MSVYKMTWRCTVDFVFCDNHHLPNPIDAEELVPPLEAAVPVRHAPGDDPGDVDGRVLLLAAHHVEAQPLLCLGQLHHSGVSVTLGCSERGHCGFSCGTGPGAMFD